METKEQNPDFLLQRWVDGRCSEQKVMDDLTNLDLPSEQKEQLLKSYRKHLSDKKQKQGFILMGLGSFIGFLSCVLTMVDFIPAFNGLFLYGLTTLAIVVILYGCYLVFE